MKNVLLAFMLMAILITGTLSIPAFGQSAQISVEADKEEYNPGDTISLSGMISKIISGTPVTIQLKAANGNVISVGQITPGEDSTWSHQIKLSSKTKVGEYTVSVLYGNWKNETTFTVGYGTASQPQISTPTTTATTPKDSLMYEFEDIGINYKITGGSITAIYPDPESNSLIIEILATDDGMLTISLPREVIDSEGEGPLNGEFFVLLDSEQNDFEETETAGTYRTLNIEFLAGSEVIEIIGTVVIPEFGVIAIMVLAVALISIIAITSRSGLLQITRL